MSGQNLIAGEKEHVMSRSDLQRSRRALLRLTVLLTTVACRAALEVIKIIEEEHLLDRALKIGEKLKERFLKMKDKYSLMGDVRGIGAMIAVEMVKHQKTKKKTQAPNHK